MSLSDKINDKCIIYPSEDFIYITNVKEFIKELKKEIVKHFLNQETILKIEVFHKINKIAGEKLSK